MVEMLEIAVLGYITNKVNFTTCNILAQQIILFEPLRKNDIWTNKILEGEKYLIILLIFFNPIVAKTLLVGLCRCSCPISIF